MKTTDLFAFNRSSKRLNESLAKTFGRKINLETFSVEQLEDARNKLRTQIYTARSSSNFNETVDNDTLSQAQFMHDAIVAELAERDEPIVDNTEQEGADRWTDADQARVDAATLVPGRFYIMASSRVQDGESPYNPKNGFKSADEADAYFTANRDDFYDDAAIMQWNGKDFVPSVDEEADYGVTEGGNFDEQELSDVLKAFDEQVNEIGGNGQPDYDKIISALDNGDIESAMEEIVSAYSDQDGGEISSNDYDNYLDDLESEFKFLVHSDPQQRVSSTRPLVIRQPDDKRATFNQGESLQNEAYINNAEDAINLLAAIRKQSKMAERGGGEPVRPNQLVNDLWDVMQWIEANMKESIETESKNTGDNMRNLREGEIQQASAIVTAKTMVDRVGRWIEELSGMENDTLLQLGDSIRDEMGQEQAKAFIEAVAPAIQQALDTLKGTRDTLSTGVRSLASGEQPTDMLGAEPGADMAAPAEPDAMNAEPGAEMGADIGGDDFAAAEPAAGGIGDAGREQRESIDRQSRLMKVLAG
jgi:hypothetical protein